MMYGETVAIFLSHWIIANKERAIAQYGERWNEF